MSKEGTKNAFDSIIKLSELKDISGKNAKRQYIEDNKKDKLFIDTLHFLLNPMIITGISKKKITKDTSDVETDVSIYNIYELYRYLLNNNTGRDIDIKIVQDAINNISLGDGNSDMINILSEVVTKSYKLGVTRNTVNEVIPKLIPHFSPMLAKSFESITNYNDELKNGYMLSLKLNGVRAVVRKENGNVTIRSREGREFVGITDIKNEYLKSELPDGVYDGELQAIILDGETTDEAFRRTISLVMSHEETDGVEHIVFEYLTLSEWDNEHCDLLYENRKDRFVKVISYNTSNKIKQVPFLLSENNFNQGTMNTIYSTLKRVTKDGYEGIMINPHDKPYIFKRGKSLYKAKEFDSADLLVLDIYEGEGRLKGTMGGVTLSWRNENKFNLGTGFTDSDRDKYWNNPELIVGKIVEINYQSESENLNGGEAVQFGSFQDIRHDKGIEDIRYSDKD